MAAPSLKNLTCADFGRPKEKQHVVGLNLSKTFISYLYFMFYLNSVLKLDDFGDLNEKLREQSVQVRLRYDC